MTTPFVIDNQQHRMAAVLNDLLAQHKGHSLYIATVLRGYLNSPAVSRAEVIAAIQKVNQPLPAAFLKDLRRAYESFAASGQPGDLLLVVQSIGQEQAQPAGAENASKAPVRREDLKLVCFDYVWQ